MTTLSQFQKALYFALFTFVLCSGLAAAAQWSSTQLSLDYSNDDNVQPPAAGTPVRTVWELIAAAEKNDQTAFCSALEVSEEKCAEIFDVWRKRIGTEYPIRLVALGSRQEHEACVSVTTRNRMPRRLPMCCTLLTMVTETGRYMSRNQTRPQQHSWR